MLKDLKKLSGGSWLPLVVLVALLALVIFGAYYALTLNADIAMSSTGYISMAIGVLFSLVVGVGLMALIFFSSRRGYDEPPTIGKRRDEDDKP